MKPFGIHPTAPDSRECLFLLPDPLSSLFPAQTCRLSLTAAAVDFPWCLFGPSSSKFPSQGFLLFPFPFYSLFVHQTHALRPGQQQGHTDVEGQTVGGRSWCFPRV